MALSWEKVSAQLQPATSGHARIVLSKSVLFFCTSLYASPPPTRIWLIVVNPFSDLTEKGSDKCVYGTLVLTWSIGKTRHRPPHFPTRCQRWPPNPCSVKARMTSNTAEEVGGPPITRIIWTWWMMKGFVRSLPFFHEYSGLQIYFVRGCQDARLTSLTCI